jgi:hypothetical protein
MDEILKKHIVDLTDAERLFYKTVKTKSENAIKNDVHVSGGYNHFIIVLYRMIITTNNRLCIYLPEINLKLNTFLAETLIHCDSQKISIIVDKYHGFNDILPNLKVNDNDKICEYYFIVSDNRYQLILNDSIYLQYINWCDDEMVENLYKLFFKKAEQLTDNPIIKIAKLGELMLYKINKNKYKECSVMNFDGGGRKWINCDYKWLLMRLREEADEIEKAILNNETPEEIALECADVCNFAMMIADNAGGLKKK